MMYPQYLGYARHGANSQDIFFEQVKEGMNVHKLKYSIFSGWKCTIPWLGTMQEDMDLQIQ